MTRLLGKTAGGLFWMFRLLERSENTARLLDAGFRIALTRSDAAQEEWNSILTTTGTQDIYFRNHERADGKHVIDFLLRDKSNPSSVLSTIEAARNNARAVRASLTREVWEATNIAWLTLREILGKPVRERELPAALNAIRKHSSMVRGTMYGTMMRNDIFDFSRIGSFLERADNTARILDVKYYVLLPTASCLGSSLDNVQWETILSSVSATRSYRWVHEGKISAPGIAHFLILDTRMPRSLAFCYGKIEDNLGYLTRDYGICYESHGMASSISRILNMDSIDVVFENGLHEFLSNFLGQNTALGRQIEKDFRFYE